MPSPERAPRVHVTTVVDRRELAPGVVLLAASAPELARNTKAGQFVMAIPPGGEEAATALGIYDAQDERVSLLFFITGKRTTQLAALHLGDRLELTGPLGNGFDLATPSSNVAIVAGGTGIASVLLAARSLVSRGSSVRLFYGARTAALLVEADRFEKAGCELVLATDDGSRGRRGFVTDALRDAPASKSILACGPSPMLRAVGRIAAAMDVRAQLSLEETFACGVGGCWGCVVPLVRTSAQAPSFPPGERGGGDVVHARVCREGPVFWSDELRW